MANIIYRDTDGDKSTLLPKGNLGYDDYPEGGDEGRVYVGTGTENKALAFKSEIDNLRGTIGNIESPLLDLPLQDSLDMYKGYGNVLFERSTTATYIDKYGILQYADVNEPRFEKDGLLIEGEGTNLCFYSQDFTVSDFYPGNNGTLDQEKLNIDRSNEAVKLVTSTTSEVQQFNKVHNVFPADSTITSSIVVEKDGVYDYLVMISGNFVSWDTRGYVIFNLADGTIYKESTDDGDGTISGAITHLGDGKYGCEMRGQVRNSDDNTSNLYICIREEPETSEFEGDGTSGVILHNIQFEEAPFATSYIKTSNTAVTRGTDICSLTGINNMTRKIDSYSISITHNSLGTLNPALGVNSRQRIFMFMNTINSAGNWKYYYNPNTDLSHISTTFYWSTARSSSVGYATNEDTTTVIVNDNNISGYIYKNGVLSSINTGLQEDDGSAQITDIIYLGSLNRYRQLYGHLRNLKIYDKALTAVEVALLGGN